MARLLDLTRLVSRVGRGPFTGIDRVELAYLQALLARPEPLFAVLRSAPGHVLLDRDGAAALLGRLKGDARWGNPDWLARLHLRQTFPRRCAYADLRRLAHGQAPGWRGLARLLPRKLPRGVVYLNTGHANLSAPMLAAVRQVPQARIAVMIHDTIPLDHPDCTRPGVPERFAAMLGRVATQADLVICNSAVTEAALARHLGTALPPTLVAHLGTDPPRPDPGALAAAAPPALRRALDQGRPVFVVLGTIEPRKNHALLLDTWELLAQRLGHGDSARMPLLAIVGARGWRNEAVFNRLDTGPLVGSDILELGALNDGAAGALMSRARALLFPSRAEGFGLPAVEACALGIPVVCSDLPTFREVLRDYPVYVANPHSYAWADTIQGLARPDPPGPRPVPPWLPDWETHFDTVLARV